MAALRKFFGASRPMKQTILAAAATVVIVRAGLSFLPFPRFVRLVECLSRPSRLGAHRNCPAEDVAWAVRGVSRRVPKATCLTQALSLNLLLTRRGEKSEVKIGIARTGERGLKSHAWVEQDGRIIIGDNGELDVYSTMVSLEGAGSFLRLR